MQIEQSSSLSSSGIEIDDGWQQMLVEKKPMMPSLAKYWKTQLLARLKPKPMKKKRFSQAEAHW